MKDRKYCITIKADEYDWTYMKNIFCDKMRYLIMGLELSKEGYLHYQCYIQLNKQYRLKGLKKLIGIDSLHAEIQKGTNKEARNYCWKGYFEPKGTKHPQPSAVCIQYGTFCEGQGKRTEMNEIKEDIDEGLEHYDICQNQKKFASYARYSNWFFKYKEMRDDDVFNNIRKPLKVNVIYGKFAVGKTQSIYNEHGYKNCYKLKNPNGDNKNWNGYTNQKILIIDDFYGWLRLNDILNILDNKPYRVRKLRGYTWAQWTTVYITSNDSFKDWYSHCENKKIINAFYSRLSKCLKVIRGNTGTLIIKEILIPCRNRNKQKEYLNISGMFDEWHTKCENIEII